MLSGDIFNVWLQLTLNVWQLWMSHLKFHYFAKTAVAKDIQPVFLIAPH